MKKILLSAVIASSFAMSGDVAKCSEAWEKSQKHHDLEFVENQKARDLEFVENEKNMSDEVKRIRMDMYRASLIKSKVHRNLAYGWDVVGREECKGVLNEEVYRYYYGS